MDGLAQVADNARKGGGGMMLRRVMTVVLLLAALIRPAAGDDHGNQPAEATLIPSGSSPVAGLFEHDLDRDWFRFVAAPTLVYTIQVSNVTLWDNAFAIRAFAEGETLRATNSAFASNSSRIVWTNNGGERFYYVGVSPLFDFTTGTYTVAVSTNDVDADGDGMADAWELAMFGTTTNGAAGDPDLDGLTTIQEYRSGTHPAQSASGLRVTNIARQVNGSLVGWPAVAYGAYRIETSTNVSFASSWQSITNVSQSGVPGPMVVLDGSATNRVQHYRVVYE